MTVMKNSLENHKSLDLEIGQSIRSLRKASKISQTALAEVVELDQSGISRIESGKQSLTPTQIKLVCEYFDIDPKNFLYGTLDFSKISAHDG